MPTCHACQNTYALGADSCPHCQAELSPAAKLASHALGFFNAQFYSEAAAMFEEAHQAAPDDAEFETAWAHALHHQGRRDKAARIYHRLDSLGLRSPEIAFNLAQTDLARGRLDAAREAFERLTKAEVHFEPHQFYLGCLYAGPSEFRSDCLHYLALIHWNQGNTAFARLYLDQAVELSPGHAPAQRYLGNLHFQAKEFAQAAERLQQFLALTLGTSANEDHQIEARFRLGSSLAELNRTTEAIEEFKRVLERRPGHPGAIHHLSRLYAQSGIAGEEDSHGPPVIEASEGASTIFGLSAIPPTKADSQSGSAPTEHRPIIGKSLPMQRVLRAARLSAASDSSILILGENGTGKELIAHAIHENSARRSGPFITISCAAIAENLLESELFGHERGAFTGAVNRRLGRFEMAAGGTVFLDEVSALTPAMQVKLLRFLQERVFTRVGGEEIIRADVRLISATNAKLDEMIQQGTFREDFYFRLSVLPIAVPPLRERPEDIPLLAEYFIQKYKNESVRRDTRLDPEDIALLQAYHWPGNVRELENIIERSLVMGIQVGSILASKSSAHSPLPSARSDESAGEMITRLISEGRIPERRRRGVPSKSGQPSWQPTSLEALEKEHILRTLQHTHSRRSEAARLLGINPATLWRKMKQYEIESQDGQKIE